MVSISSVSGGSLTNGFVGLDGDYTAQSPGAFRGQARQLASQIANRGTLFAWVGTKLYLAALVVTGLIRSPVRGALAFLDTQPHRQCRLRTQGAGLACQSGTTEGVASRGRATITAAAH